MVTPVSNKHQEAVSFLGRKGVIYAEKSATPKEREYFKDLLYNKEGTFQKSLLRSIIHSQA